MMKMLKNHKHLFLKAFLLCFMIGLLSISLFVAMTLSETSLSEIKDVLQNRNDIAKRNANNDTPISVLEAGGFVIAEQLHIFNLLTTNPSFTVDKKIHRTKGPLAIEEAAQLAPLQVNDCKSVYCLQQRRSFSQIPSAIWKSLIAIEDIRFISHAGFDLKAIARAIVKDIIAMGFVEGASTITQQLAKNIFFSAKKSVARKLKEIVVSVAIEATFEKDEILQAYLNEVYWGVLQGIQLKGFHVASLAYFNKLPADLDDFEAVILVSLLKGPGYFAPTKNLERLKSRVQGVVASLNIKKVFASGIRQWSDEEWQRWHQSLMSRESGSNRYLYSLWAMQASHNKFPAISEYEAYVLFHNMQSQLYSSRQRVEGVDLAAKILVADWNEKERETLMYSKIERSLDTAINVEQHQVGSTLKPVVYSELVELGVELEAPVETSPITLKLKSGAWTPDDSHKVQEEYISFATALQQSLNRPLIRKANEVGFDKIEERLIRTIPRLKQPLREYPAQLLGSVELSLSEMLQIYRGFLEKECRGDSKIMSLLNDPNQTTIKRVVGKVLSQMQFFGKTGTTNDGRDNWFVYFDGKLLATIWVGQEGNRQGKALPLYGSTTAFKILENYLLYRGKLFDDATCAMQNSVETLMETAI